jgi:hypothetical protein
MGLIMRLGGRNAAAFLICCLAGYNVGTLLPVGAWAAFGSILVSYHLFLIWLVITADHPAGFSMPVASTILTHSACLAIVISLGLGRRYIPFFGFVRFAITALAPFECEWLFSGNGKSKPQAVKPSAVALAAVAAATAAAATAEDYEAWLNHLANRNPASRKSGSTIKHEYEQFMVARAKSRL